MKSDSLLPLSQEEQKSSLRVLHLATMLESMCIYSSIPLVWHILQPKETLDQHSQALQNMAMLAAA